MSYSAQELLDLNSFWATAIANDIVLTVTASRSGVQQGQYVRTLPFESYRLPITLPQPGFTVCTPHSVLVIHPVLLDCIATLIPMAFCP